MSEKLFVKNIRIGGMGGEARVMVQSRNIFPGLGGDIKSKQAVACALREEFFTDPDEGQRLFLKHVLIKKLDDYFLRIGAYNFPHVARPLGSMVAEGEVRESYLYEWVFGQEAFPWECQNTTGGHDMVTLEEWSEFSRHFREAGINMEIDITDPDNGRISKNVIHQLCHLDDNLCLSAFWKRIDFGDNSIQIDYPKVKRFLDKNIRDLIDVLGLDRFRLIFLAEAYLANEIKLTEEEMDELVSMARKYRLSTLRHKLSELVIP
ncbi:MAG: hypothetical protein Q7S32_00220 [bacterium]|nr:hypothetical protein [bacterium]